MKLKALHTIVALLFIVCAIGQKLTIDPIFTAVNNGVYVQLDSIKVMNRSQQNHSMVFWPDTSSTIDIAAGDTMLFIGYSMGSPIGIEDMNDRSSNFQISQNYPNPAYDHTMFSVTIPEKGNVQFLVTNISGQEVFRSERMLNKGIHTFRFSPGKAKLFLLTASWNGVTRAIKVITIEANSRSICDIDYIDSRQGELQLKTSSFKQTSVLESGILDNPSVSETYTFQFAANIPCPGTPTVSYSGKVYNTVQILSQCWLKENLNVGTRIDAGIDMTDDSVLEKYCYDNVEANCTKYGGLYQWNEMMQYTAMQGTQGICPSGWHIPADEEWKVLEGAVDSQYGIGNPEWDSKVIRGFDVGTRLKSTNGWESSGSGSDLFGFAGLPGGISNPDGIFYLAAQYAYWWTSTEHNADRTWYNFLNYNSPDVTRLHNEIDYSFSVRCVRDE